MSSNFNYFLTTYTSFWKVTDGCRSIWVVGNLYFFGIIANGRRSWFGLFGAFLNQKLLLFWFQFLLVQKNKRRIFIWSVRLVRSFLNNLTGHRFSFSTLGNNHLLSPCWSRPCVVLVNSGLYSNRPVDEPWLFISSLKKSIRKDHTSALCRASSTDAIC